MSKADPLVPRGLRRGSAAFRLLGLRVPIPPEACMTVPCECYVLSGKGLCNWPIPCLEEPYREWADAVLTLYLH